MPQLPRLPVELGIHRVGERREERVPIGIAARQVPAGSTEFIRIVVMAVCIKPRSHNALTGKTQETRGFCFVCPMACQDPSRDTVYPSIRYLLAGTATGYIYSQYRE
jgi:hypothetical protein